MEEIGLPLDKRLERNIYVHTAGRSNSYDLIFDFTPLSRAV
jgi:hypothetical protein